VKAYWRPVRGINPYCVIAAMKTLAMKPDLVYGRFLAGCYCCSVLGLPTVFETHTPVIDRNKVSHLLFSRMSRGKKLRRLVVISDALRRYFESTYQIGNDIILLAHDAADEPRNQNSMCLSSDPTRLQVGYVGHLYEGKGMELIVKIADHCPWADFHIVGGLPEDIAHWKGVAKGDNIIFHGFIPHGKTDAYRRACDVLLAPYKKNVFIQGRPGDIGQWMSPLKLFEYMAAGKAIVCSDLPVLREVMHDGETALLCSADSPKEWAGALARLRDDVSLRNRLGSCAREVFQANHTWRGRAERVIDALP